MPQKQAPTDGTHAPYPSALQDYRDILFNAPIGIFTSTPHGHFVYANPALARMYGYDSVEELLGSVNDLVRQTYADPADRAFFVSQLEEYGEIVNDECRLRRKDGSFFWVSRTARLIRDPNEETTYYQGFTTDITARKEAEQLLGTPIIERFHPDSHDNVRQRIQILNEKQRPIDERYELQFIGLDGSAVWVETSGQPILYHGSHGALVFVRDSSQRKAVEGEREDTRGTRIRHHRSAGHRRSHARDERARSGPNHLTLK